MFQYSKPMRMSPEYSEVIAAVAIGILTAIFISAFVVLVIICRRQKLYYKATNRDSYEDTTRYSSNMSGKKILQIFLQARSDAD